MYGEMTMIIENENVKIEFLNCEKTEFGNIFIDKIEKYYQSKNDIPF